MLTNKFTGSAKAALKSAASLAAELGHTHVGTEHLLYALLSGERSVAGDILRGRGVTESGVRTFVTELSGVGTAGRGGDEMTPALCRVISHGAELAKKYGHPLIGTEELLLSLSHDRECAAMRLLIARGVSPTELQNDIVGFFGDMGGGTETASAAKPNKSAGALAQYGKDLTALASVGLLGPVIGRDTETERVIHILSRKTKNNPCLIGEPGVGKTAVVEGLAARIASGNVPGELGEKSVVALDLGAMIAGAKYRGEFEDRLKKVMAEASKDKSIILFIDEMHIIVGAGAAEGAVDAANILKPVLARGELQIIGATTTEEYRRHIEKDAALERRFQAVTVAEPGEEETLRILQGLRKSYEAHHHVEITDGALTAAVGLSVRYIPDRFLPDKAIDLIDEAAAGKRLSETGVSPDCLLLEKEARELQSAKEEAIKRRAFEEAANLRTRLSETEDRLREARAAWNRERTTVKTAKVTEEDIAALVTAWTGIPVEKSGDGLGERLLHLEERLSERIIGQGAAISAVSRAIRRGRVGLSDPMRPMATLLFMGPTGVGKTALAAAVAELVFGSPRELIRLDMSEYMEKHSVSKLIGSPPGYVGYEDGGGLSEKVRRRPYSVVLFDEIEKAHSDVYDLLLQILDDGILTDSAGKSVSFKNTVIILTTNLGNSEKAAGGKLGFSDMTASEQAKDLGMEALRGHFRPEFLGRMDEIVMFSRLSNEDLKKIAKKMLSQVRERIEGLGMNAEFDESVTEMLISHMDSARYGARPLRRELSTRVEDVFSMWILEGRVRKGERIRVTVENGALAPVSK